MSHIQGGNVTVMVTNMDTAVKFYTETLGLSLKNRYGNHWADVEGQGIAIGLHPTTKDVNRGDNLQIGLRVADLDRAMADFKQKGIRFKMNNDDRVRLAFFTDPDGNTLYLVQPGW